MEDDQQFCLRWNNHQSTLISVFDNLLASETLVDCTLAAEGKHLKAHKVVLSACSPYFASLLKEQYDKHPIFILKDVKYQELRYMMDYMYRGEVNISQDQLAALLKAAESLQIKGLSDNRPSVPKPEQQQHQQHQHPHHRATLPTNVGSVSGVVPKYPGSNYTLEQTKRTRLSGRTMGSIDTSEMDSREGSSSPSRKHRKLRRKSQDNAMNDTLDNSNSSQLLQSNQQQHLQQQQQQQQVVNANVVAGLSGVGAITAAASALAAGSAAGAVLHTGPSLAAAAAAAAAAAVASVGPTSSSAGGGGSSVKKTDSLKATSQADTMNIIDSQTAGGSNMSIVASSSVTDAVSDHHHQHQTLHHHQYQAHHTDTTTGTDNKMNHKQKLQQQQQPSSKDIISTNQSELVIEPKSEYDDEANDEAVEDLTLDEEDMGMDDLDQKAGPSQGGEGSSQGYAPWQQDQSQDDLLLNAQEAQQRDPQDLRTLYSIATATAVAIAAAATTTSPVCKSNNNNDDDNNKSKIKNNNNNNNPTLPSATTYVVASTATASSSSAAGTRIATKVAITNITQHLNNMNSGMNGINCTSNPANDFFVDNELSLHKMYTKFCTTLNTQQLQKKHLHQHYHPKANHKNCVISSLETIVGDGKDESKGVVGGGCNAGNSSGSSNNGGGGSICSGINNGNRESSGAPCGVCLIEEDNCTDCQYSAAAATSYQLANLLGSGMLLAPSTPPLPPPVAPPPSSQQPPVGVATSQTTLIPIPGIGASASPSVSVTPATAIATAAVASAAVVGFHKNTNTNLHINHSSITSSSLSSSTLNSSTCASASLPKKLNSHIFHCEFCSFSCSWKYDLQLHKRQKHGVHNKKM